MAAECPGEMLGAIIASGHGDIDDPCRRIDEQLPREIETRLLDDIGIGPAALLEAALEGSAAQPQRLRHEGEGEIAIGEVGPDCRAKRRGEAPVGGFVGFGGLEPRSA